jgi:hypothetical protein
MQLRGVTAVLIRLFASAVIVAGCSILLLIVILAVRTGLRSIEVTLALAVLTLVEGALVGAGQDAPVAGAFHAVDAVLALELAVFLTGRAWRGTC